MKPARTARVKLADSSTMKINHSEWAAVANRKWFDKTNTEIVRVTRHESELLTRVYAMRSASGKVVKEVNHMLHGDNLDEIVQKAIDECGIKHITKAEVM